MIKLIKMMKMMRMIMKMMRMKMMRRMRMMHRGGTATRRRCRRRTTMLGSSELLRKTKPLSDPPGAVATFFFKSVLCAHLSISALTVCQIVRPI